MALPHSLSTPPPSCPPLFCAVVCPGETPCSGHGLCTTMAGLATLRTTNGDLTPTSYGAIPNKKETWDFNRVYGCYCDHTWTGYDCSQRTCPPPPSSFGTLGLC